MGKMIAKNDLLFHFAHGLCRVDAITGSAQSKDCTYVLLPVLTTHAKVRFMIPQSSMEASGFSKLVSSKEASAILDYFKTGKAKTKPSPIWTLAETILSESCSKEPVKDARKRQKLERAVAGLIGGIAFVLKMTLQEVADKIKNNLAMLSSINPAVLHALSNVNPN